MKLCIAFQRQKNAKMLRGRREDRIEGCVDWGVHGSIPMTSVFRVVKAGRREASEAMDGTLRPSSTRPRLSRVRDDNWSQEGKRSVAPCASVLMVVCRI